MIRVLLADDHAIVLEGLRALLDGESDMKVAAWTTDGTEVMKLVDQHKPDVVVLDLELSTIKGTEVIAALRDRPTRPKVLVLTAYNDGESLRSALDAGAEGLALKTESPQQTLTAIRQVHAGQLVFPQAARRWIEGRGAAPGDLTPREREVWALVAGGLTNPPGLCEIIHIASRLTVLEGVPTVGRLAGAPESSRLTRVVDGKRLDAR